jgi:hypothetical protein
MLNFDSEQKLISKKANDEIEKKISIAWNSLEMNNYN